MMIWVDDLSRLFDKTFLKTKSGHFGPESEKLEKIKIFLLVVKFKIFRNLIFLSYLYYDYESWAKFEQKGIFTLKRILMVLARNFWFAGKV